MKKQFFRVKQLADQTFLRADKSEVLNNEELKLADQKIEYLQTAVSSIIKKIPHIGQNNDNEKRIKKSTEHHLALAFLEQNLRKVDQLEPQENNGELFSNIVQKCGNIEQELAKEYAEYEKQIEDLVSAPIQSLLDNDFHNILKQKRNLSKYILDKDSASNRYNATKKEALKDDMEEADYKVEQSRDVLAYEMFSLLSKENDLAGYMLQILKCQRAYHECALNRLRDVIPLLEKQIGDSSVKRIYGISLAEHLRVTGRRIALPLEVCVTLLHRHGLDEEGLFRIAGSTSRTKRLRSSIDSGCFSPKLIPEYMDVHVLASALKMYLRELPDPLLTGSLYGEWMRAMQKPDGVEKLETVKGLVGMLPKENRENLAYLMQFLAELSRHPMNKMSSSNIAIVMAPNLLWDGSEVMNMGNCASVNMLVELFIKEVTTLFPEDTGKLGSFPWMDDDGFIKTNVEFNVSSENVSVAESPKPNSRKKKTPAPGPPNSVHMSSKTDQDIIPSNERNIMSASYPSGSATLNRHKPKDVTCKTSVGVNTEQIRPLEEKQQNNNNNNNNNNRSPIPELPTQQNLVNLDSTKTVAHKVVTEPAQPVQVSKAKPVQPVVIQNAACESGGNKNFKTTVTHSVESGAQPQKPVAAPRSIDGGVTRSSSIRIELRHSDDGVQIRRNEGPVVAKPEVPARPASLSAKRPSQDTDPSALHRTQCSVYSVANKQQPSYVNVHNRNEKFQPGHDNQIAEKEKFLGHQPLPCKFPDINSNSKPPRGPVRTPETTKSNENLEQAGATTNGNQKASHARTRSDGNIAQAVSPPSPRSLNKPTQPPPPPPVAVVKKEADSTDL